MIQKYLAILAILALLFANQNAAEVIKIKSEFFCAQSKCGANCERGIWGETIIQKTTSFLYTIIKTTTLKIGTDDLSKIHNFWTTYFTCSNIFEVGSHKRGSRGGVIEKIPKAGLSWVVLGCAVKTGKNGTSQNNFYTN